MLKKTVNAKPKIEKWVLSPHAAFRIASEDHRRGGKFTDRTYHHGSLRNQKSVNDFPEVYIDKDADFASIKIAAGVENRSYLKDGVVVCEDAKGRIIEIQLLNLRSLLASKKRFAA